MRNLLSLLAAQAAPLPQPPKMEVGPAPSDPLASILSSAQAGGFRPIVVPTMPEIGPTAGLESLAPGLGGTLADAGGPQVSDSLRQFGLIRDLPNLPSDLATSTPSGFMEDIRAKQGGLRLREKNARAARLADRDISALASTMFEDMPDPGGTASLFPEAPISQAAPGASATGRGRAVPPTAPTLERLGAFDPDLRGQERNALTSFIVGSILGGPRAGIAAATGAAQGFAQGRANAFAREANRVSSNNKAEIDLFKEQNDMFGELSKLENNLDLETMRQKGRDEDRTSREMIAQRQIEGAMKRTNATLHNDLLKFQASDQQKKQETSQKLLEWIYENAGSMEDLDQSLLVQRYNVYAQQAGLPPMAVPGTPVLDAQRKAIMNPDGSVARVPRIGASPKVMNAQTAATNAETNTVLAKSLVGDRLTKADLAERELAVQAAHLQNMDTIAAKREIRAEEQQQWLRASKAIDQELARARNSIRGTTGTPTPQQAAAIQKELALSGKAIEAIRAKAGEKPDPDMDTNGTQLAQWNERRAALEQTAIAYRDYLNAQAARIGYTFNGTAYVPAATPQLVPPPAGTPGNPGAPGTPPPAPQPPAAVKVFGPSKKSVDKMTSAEIKALPPSEYAAAVAELKRIMGGK